MGHQALAIVQALGFGHGEPGIQQIFQTTDVEIHDAGIPLGVLAHVAAEPDGLAVFHLGDGSLLQLFDGQVEVAHGAALFHVAQVLHGVAAAVGLILGGSIDEADIVAQVNAYILFKEALGGQALFTVEVVVLIAVLKGKGLGRLAQADAEQAVDLAQHPGLVGAQLVQALALLVQLAQDAGILPQLLGQRQIHLAAAGRSLGLGVSGRGHHAVLLDQIAEHIPLAAVVHRGHQQIGHQTAIGGLVQRVEDALEEVVGFFQLIPEKEVGLRELKGLEVVLLHHLIAQGVEGRKHPAAAALLLVADLALLQADGVFMDILLHSLAADGGSQQAVVRHGVHGHAVGALGAEIGVKGCDLFFCNFLRHWFYVLSYHSLSGVSASATRARWNMLSTTAQYLSARQTMTASRQVGMWRNVSGHMWLWMMFCSFLVIWK